jgi:TRAP-type C4-dicarboxylate transport system substrate-binding protein
MVNKGTWDGLDDATKSALQKAGDETGAACAAKSAELSSFYFEELAKNGMTVEDAPADFLAELKVIGEKMQADWLATVGEDGQAILDAFAAN